MNENMRKEINKIIDALEELRSQVTNLADEEQEKFDNLTEGLQAGEKGQRIEEAAQALQNADSSFDDIISYLEEAKGE